MKSIEAWYGILNKTSDSVWQWVMPSLSFVPYYTTRIHRRGDVSHIGYVSVSDTWWICSRYVSRSSRYVSRSIRNKNKYNKCRYVGWYVSGQLCDTAQSNNTPVPTPSPLLALPPHPNQTPMPTRKAPPPPAGGRISATPHRGRTSARGSSPASTCPRRRSATLLHSRWRISSWLVTYGELFCFGSSCSTLPFSRILHSSVKFI